MPDAVALNPVTLGMMDCMLCAGAALWTEYLTLEELVVQIAMRDEVYRRLIPISGVGPVTALSFKTAIDDPKRFRRSCDVAAFFGPTAKRWQSGSSIDVQGRISKTGDPDVRRSRYEAASAMPTRFKGCNTIETWGLHLAKTKRYAKARIAVACKLAAVMHTMWPAGPFYICDPDTDAKPPPVRAARKDLRLLGARV